MVSWIVRAASWAFDSALAVNAGRAIGCFGFAGPMIRMIGTDGIGASGGGVALWEKESWREALSARNATNTVTHNRRFADFTSMCLLLGPVPRQSRVKVNSIWTVKLGASPWGSGGKLASWIAVVKDRSTVS